MPPPVSVLYTPGPRSSIDEVAAGRDAVYASIYDNVVGSIHAFRFTDGKWSDTKLVLPPGGSTHIVSTNDFGPEALVQLRELPQIHHALCRCGGRQAGGDQVAAGALRCLGAYDRAVRSHFERRHARSRTSYVRQKDAKGPQPTMLYGYGGFEISMNPSYSANFGKLWLTQGGAFVVANIRGGGEFGPAWHQAALKDNRQRAYDDFAGGRRPISKGAASRRPSSSASWAARMAGCW